MSSIVNQNIQLWRQKSRDGTITVAEMREAVQAMRAERVGAAGVSAASKEKKATTAAKKAPIDSDSLLGELGL